jgi:hypothetical protein
MIKYQTDPDRIKKSGNAPGSLSTTIIITIRMMPVTVISTDSLDCILNICRLFDIMAISVIG